jgi:hypothetical protein
MLALVKLAAKLIKARTEGGVVWMDHAYHGCLVIIYPCMPRVMDPISYILRLCSLPKYLGKIFL